MADDENLDIAKSLGFHGLNLSNDHGLGYRFNAGFTYAAIRGADLFVHVGSDDWVHPNAFDILPDTGEIVAFNRIDFLDITTGKLRRGEDPGAFGSIPWLIPRDVLEPSNFLPVQNHVNRGIEYSLVGGLGMRPNWKFSPVAGCVDIKSPDSMTPYAGTWVLGAEEIDAWPYLADNYAPGLAELARLTHKKGLANVG